MGLSGTYPEPFANCASACSTGLERLLVERLVVKALDSSLPPGHGPRAGPRPRPNSQRHHRGVHAFLDLGLSNG